MEFKDLLTQIKEFIAPELLAILAIFYFGFNKIFKAMKKFIGIQNEYEELKERVEKMDKENKERDLQNFQKISQVNHKIDDVKQALDNLVINLIKK
jgi:uncharacterized membrane protein (DUF106 family)